jgi:hypothetical protein
MFDGGLMVDGDHAFGAVWRTVSRQECGDGTPNTSKTFFTNTLFV